MPVRPCPLPPSSALADLVPGWATWVDCWEAPLSRPATALALWRATLARQPGWLDAALRLRDRIVRPFGVRPVGTFAKSGAPAAPTVGDRLGIFTVRAVGDDEIVLGDDDRHLDFRLSVARSADATRMTIGMVLRTHNRLGRLYMLPVAPIHRLIVRGMLERAVRDGAI